MSQQSTDRVRIDVLPAGQSSVEERSLYLLEKLKNAEITISDLMGPLYGLPNLTPEILIPPGTKARSEVAGDSEFLPKESEHNITLQKHVHPHDYLNPTPGEEDYDLIAIGGGVSGLISVIIGAWLGKKCALIERHGMGGDCLNTGCVPSKALIACARAMHSTKSLSEFGVKIPDGEVKLDFNFIMERMRKIRAKISHHDSVERYSRDFCKDVYVGHANFAGGNKIEVTGDNGEKRVLSFKKAMIATGASASIPPVPGLVGVPILTNSNFFNQTELPPRMLVIGCGPIGLELSQAMARFGCKVTCLENATQLLSREDPDAVKILHKQLLSDGVNIHTGVKILSVSYNALPDGGLYKAPWGIYTVTVESDGKQLIFEAEALLNATGRSPNVHDVGLENVGVEWDNRNGVHINEMFQTANPDIYACGDCATPYKFTHSAEFQARMAVRNMFLGDTNKLSQLLIPWCTYTDPEIAHVGKYEKELTESGVPFEVFTKQLGDVDRCMCDGVEEGFVKIIVRAGTDEIVGATICGPTAGDMITEITLCMQYGIGVPQIAGTIHPYPTTQEAVRHACLGFNKYFKDPDGVCLSTLRKVMAENDK